MFLEQVTTEQKPQGLRVMIYGEPKVGKSYFGAQIPNHVFLNLENGLEHLKGANKLPYTDNYDDVKLMLKELENCEHPFKTLVVDSADWSENIIESILKLIQQRYGYNGTYQNKKKCADI